MRRLISCLFAVAALAGCQSKQIEEMSYTERNDLAKQIAQRCADQGFADRHPQQDACIKAEVDREVSMRRNAQVRAENARIALANGMGAMSNSYNNQAAAYNANRPMNCTTTPHSTFVGGTPSSYSTSCY